MVAVAENNIELDACTMHYLEAGNTERQTIILLHGMKFKAQTWEDLGTLQFLASLGFRVIAVDMPGFGGSPASDIDPVSALYHFIEKLKIRDFSLIGPSMGGRIALEFAIKYGELLSSLVVVGAVGVKENREELKRILVPLLVVWGENDQVSPLGLSDTLLEQTGNAKRVVFPGASHPCYLDQPENWHQSLKSFYLSE